MPVSAGLSDFNRRLTVFGPAVGDAGFYECEAVLRSSSVPSVSAGAYLHVYGGSFTSRSHPLILQHDEGAGGAWAPRGGIAFTP